MTAPRFAPPLFAGLLALGAAAPSSAESANATSALTFHALPPCTLFATALAARESRSLATILPDYAAQGGAAGDCGGVPAPARTAGTDAISGTVAVLLRLVAASPDGAGTVQAWDPDDWPTFDPALWNTAHDNADFPPQFDALFFNQTVVMPLGIAQPTAQNQDQTGKIWIRNAGATAVNVRGVLLGYYLGAPGTTPDAGSPSTPSNTENPVTPPNGNDNPPPSDPVIGQRASRTPVKLSDEKIGAGTFYLPSFDHPQTIVYDSGGAQIIYPGCGGVLNLSLASTAQCRFQGSLKPGITYVQRLDPAKSSNSIQFLGTGNATSTPYYDMALTDNYWDDPFGNTQCVMKGKTGVTFITTENHKQCGFVRTKLSYAVFRITPGDETGKDCGGSRECRMEIRGW